MAKHPRRFAVSMQTKDCFLNVIRRRKTMTVGSHAKTACGHNDARPAEVFLPGIDYKGEPSQRVAVTAFIDDEAGGIGVRLLKKKR
jgi:hypothetical protein